MKRDAVRSTLRTHMLLVADVAMSLPQAQIRSYRCVSSLLSNLAQQNLASLKEFVRFH